jgi:hypothetical protein
MRAIVKELRAANILDGNVYAMLSSNTGEYKIYKIALWRFE